MVLPEILDMNAAEALRAEFLSRRHTPVALDAANVQRLGGLCPTGDLIRRHDVGEGWVRLPNRQCVVGV